MPEATNKEQALLASNLSKYEKALQKKKDADKALKEIGKTIKADHGDYGLDMVKMIIACRAPETEATEKAKMMRLLDAMRWAGVDIGFQGDLFGLPDNKTPEERAFAEGKRAGMRGEPNSVPTEWAAGDMMQEWIKGWHSGQEEIFAIRAPAEKLN